MSFRLKAATIAALAISALSAVMASDASLAAGAIGSTDSLSITLPATPAAYPVEAPASQDSAIVFSAPREVVQPTTTLPSTDEATTGSPNRDSAPAASLAALVGDQSVPAEISDEMRCLAGAVYYESKGESLAGQLAVARVIINRTQSGRFASSLCGVVTQRGQFSFVRGNIVPQPPVGSRDWRTAVAIAQIALNGGWNSQAEGALFFHARRVSPAWGKAKLAAIDNHIFYR